jgi:hypothetical protein
MQKQGEETLVYKSIVTWYMRNQYKNHQSQLIFDSYLMSSVHVLAFQGHHQLLHIIKYKHHKSNKMHFAIPWPLPSPKVQDAYYFNVIHLYAFVKPRLPLPLPNKLSALTKPLSKSDSSVSILTRLWAGSLENQGFTANWGKDFLFITTSRLALEPVNPHI